MVPRIHDLWRTILQRSAGIMGRRHSTTAILGFCAGKLGHFKEHGFLYVTLLLLRKSVNYGPRTNSRFCNTCL